MQVPLESHEQIRLANYLDSRGYSFSAIRNESDFNNIGKGVKRKREGVRKGISDFCIILKRKSILFIELKRQRKTLKSGKLGVSPSKVTIEQKYWIENVNNCSNTEARICYGASEGIELIEKLEKP